MIGWLEGRVKRRDPQQGEVIIDTGGVGYALSISLQCLAAVPEEGQRCELWVHTEMREHQISLFAFASLEAKRLFTMLTTVPKVGPKLALATLSGFALEELLCAIAGADVGKLQKISGVGKRSAEQMVLTLQDRIAAAFAPLRPAEDRPNPETPLLAAAGSRREEAQAMLIALGWKAKAVEQTLIALEQERQEEEEPELDELVRQALARLMQQN